MVANIACELIVHAGEATTVGRKTATIAVSFDSQLQLWRLPMLQKQVRSCRRRKYADYSCRKGFPLWSTSLQERAGGNSISNVIQLTACIHWHVAFHPPPQHSIDRRRMRRCSTELCCCFFVLGPPPRQEPPINFYRETRNKRKSQIARMHGLPVVIARPALPFKKLDLPPCLGYTWAKPKPAHHMHNNLLEVVQRYHHCRRPTTSADTLV